MLDTTLQVFSFFALYDVAGIKVTPEEEHWQVTMTGKQLGELQFKVFDLPLLEQLVKLQKDKRLANVDLKQVEALRREQQEGAPLPEHHS